MSALSDILSLLDHWPKWKALTGTPERVDALEKRIAALEAKALPGAKVIPKGRECPSCQAEMKLISETDDPLMGAVGIRLHQLTCPACGLKTSRKYSPKDGYL